MRETRQAVKITQFDFVRHVDMSVLDLGLVSALGIMRHESALSVRFAPLISFSCLRLLISY
jgi:hypothetical protein